MKAKLILSLLFVFSLVVSVNAQSEKDAVKAVIDGLFDGMRAKDSEQILAAFSENAIMQTIQNKPEGTVIASNSVSDFAKNIGSIPVERQLDERLTDYVINIDANMATAWTPYQFFVNDKFSHCGVNSFQLVKIDNAWKIVYIIDTRRTEACVE